MKRKLPAFEVDKEGLSKLLEKRGKAWVAMELIQNAFDEDTTRVDVRITKPAGTRGFRSITVEDDNPEGFADLTHAYTLFAESAKKVDPEKRGRFNLGEKLVLACCKTATLTTTKGTIRWEGDGRSHARHRTDAGSVFTGLIRMGETEEIEVIRAIKTILVPEKIALSVNGETVLHRRPFAEIRHKLQTEIADAEGYLRRTTRKTPVRFFATAPSETATLYEMGIPVVGIDCGFHIDIGQKIPLNSDRDNVTPSYLRTVQALALNAGFDRLEEDDSREPWVTEALGSELIEAPAVNEVLKHRFGDKRVIRDPSDPEGTKIAVSKGYTVIEPRSLPADVWSTIRRTDAAKPAGQVTPSPKPYDPDGENLTTIERDSWDPSMVEFEKFAREVATIATGEIPTVTFADEPKWGYAATYGPGSLVVNVGRLGRSWTRRDNREDQLRLLIHEFGHHYASDHLSSKYHDALCQVAARIALNLTSQGSLLRGMLAERD